MKLFGRIGVLSAACLGIVLLSAACVTPERTIGSATMYAGGPRLSVDKPSIDAGDVAFRQQVKATFELTNVGDQPLQIRQVDVKTVEGC